MKKKIQPNNGANRRQFLSTSALLGIGIVTSAIPGVNAFGM